VAHTPPPLGGGGGGAPPWGPPPPTTKSEVEHGLNVPAYYHGGTSRQH